MGDSPTSSLKRAAKAERDIATSSASDATVQVNVGAAVSSCPSPPAIDPASYVYPPGRTSVTSMPVAASGPSLVTEIVNVTLSPKSGVVSSTVLPKARSADSGTVITASDRYDADIYIDKGVITLIGATTENPSFELNNALLSRARVYVLKALDATTVRGILERALDDERQGLAGEYSIDDEQLDLLARLGQVDIRGDCFERDLLADMGMAAVLRGGHRLGLADSCRQLAASDSSPLKK